MKFSKFKLLCVIGSIFLFEVSCGQNDSALNRKQETNSFNWSSNSSNIQLQASNIDSILALINNDNIKVLFDSYGGITFSFDQYSVSEVDLNRIIYDKLVLLLNDLDKDWSANIILYCMTKKRGRELSIYIDEGILYWRGNGKEEDLNYWLNYSLPNSDLDTNN